MNIIFAFFCTLGVLGLLIWYLRFTENKILFYPAKEIQFTPAERQLAFEDVLFTASDGVRLNGWFVPAKDARKTVLFAHGNAGNISHRLEKISFFHALGLSVFIFDYRGYGKSEGSPSEAGVYADVQAAYVWLLSRGILQEQIVGFGESLGGAVIIDLAASKSLAALVVETTFSSASDMAKQIYPFFPSWTFASRFDSALKVRMITCPKLFISSRNDEIVPFQLGRKLFESAHKPKEFIEIQGGHNSCFYESEKLLFEKIGNFVNKL